MSSPRRMPRQDQPGGITSGGAWQVAPNDRTVDRARLDGDERRQVRLAVGGGHLGRLRDQRDRARLGRCDPGSATPST